jgi:putative endonuclease
MRQHLETGLWGEVQAERYLRRRGFRILERRLRIGRRDELDLVCRKGKTLVFVEVKTRRRETFGRPLTAVDVRKRRALSRAAVRYLGAARYPDVDFRFDIVEVIGVPPDPRPVVRHIPNAFTLDPRYTPPY